MSANGSGLTRREFTMTTIGAGVGALVADRLGWAAPAPAKTRYAIVGVGSRSQMYQGAVLDTYAEHAQLVAVCDVNAGRMALVQARARDRGRPEPTAFPAAQFDRMIAEARPDVLIVTTPCGTHHEYICRAMEQGIDVITEKAMAVDADQCRRIVETQKKTGRSCRVTFNYRYSPPRTQVKDLLAGGAIGDVLSADFHWMLNTWHGADYFRRWHSYKAMSGGLMVHKASHHFDLVNWWLSAVPVSVSAAGKRDFYTPKMAKRLGLAGPHERCFTCPEKEACAFQLDLAANKELKALYLDNERFDGYFRDRCVFRPDIEIEDTMNVIVSYDNHATLSYSLNAFNAWEGYVVVFNGTKGRLEHKMEEQVYVLGDGTTPGAVKRDGTYIRIYPLRGPAYEEKVWEGTGGHGGGDTVMLDDIFLPEKKADKYLRAADQRCGAYAALVGIAANRMFETGQPVAIADLLPGLARPDYQTMPNHDDAVPMPPKRMPTSE